MTITARIAGDEGAQQEIHLLPVAGAGRGGNADIVSALSALKPPAAPARLIVVSSGECALLPLTENEAAGVLMEPFSDSRKQLRLFVAFSRQDRPTINGEPAPSLAVLAPGDFFQWAPGASFAVALFARPQIGPPPAAALGKPCPVCFVPFAADTICYSCACGVRLHCEADKPGALQCAQLRRECPVCRRPLVLSEGYVDPPLNQDY